MRILVADDSKTTLGLITISLTKLGHEVIPASNGQEVLEIYENDRPDLIILDVIMEGIDGFECARRIRAINTDEWIPIIFLSGAVDDENIAKGINAGGDDYLTKPFSEVTLASKIKAMQRIADMRKKLFETTQQLGILSSTDSLTGICNRFQFEKIIKEKKIQADRTKKPIALLFIDLDNFKTINDSLGHYVGDLLLQNVATRLNSCLRTDDFIARLGGDEFAIVLNKIEDAETAGKIAQKIINALAPPYQLAGNAIHVSCSIGIAYYDSPKPVETFVQNADIAMYHAKQSGRNNYQYFTEELDQQHNERLYLENALKFALERHEFFLKYQPIFDLKTKQLTRIEALACWEHPEIGLVPASIFIPLAEELGLIDAIGKWVLRQVSEQGATWSLHGLKPFKLSVNVSPRQLIHVNFPETIKNLLDDTHFSASQLELEITETSALTYSQLSKQVIDRIHALGISIALDDFGTGYSSLTHLQQLPIQAIKIDKVFIAKALIEPNSAMIIKSLIALGNNLNFDVIAEGIETEAQLEFLLENGCLQGQGFLFSHPLTREKMTELLEEQNEATHSS